MTTKKKETGLAIASDANLALNTTHHNAGAVNEQLSKAAEQCHLIAPATAVGHLPDGCGVALSAVTVDPREMKNGGDCVPMPGGLMLCKHKLNQIAAAAGISWDPQLSGRRDNGTEPNYVHYIAVAHVRQFDGSTIVITAEKIMDLREGSPQMDAIIARKRDGGSVEKQVRELRLFILEHAESKAKNRAIRSLGLKTSYTRDELKKPFVVAKLMWTGQTEDPELRKAFALLTAEKMLGGTSALFGAQAAPPMQLSAPPPVGQAPAVPDSNPGMAAPGSRGVVDAPQPQTPKSDPKPQAGSGYGNGNREHVVPWGNEKGIAIRDASEDCLVWCRNKLAGTQEGRSQDHQYYAKDQALLDAIDRELEERAGVPAGEPDDAPDGGY